MSTGQPDMYLLRTKLHRPTLLSDQVVREAVARRLDHDGRQPLTLVCAPAGFGKSTLVVQWLETTGKPAAWLSLDENDRDLRTFLNYFVEAIRSVFPDSCPETRNLLSHALRAAVRRSVLLEITDGKYQDYKERTGMFFPGRR